MINLIISDTKRSLKYLEEMLKHKINIYKIIIFSNKKKNLISKFIKDKNIINLLVYCRTKSINSPIISHKLNFYKSKFNIVSTYPGEIIKNSFILKKKLLHCHPGNLPRFKGSTTIYYTILLKKKICVTLFLMNKKIDSGKIVYKKYFKYPKKLKHIEENFDNEIRALTLVEFLKLKNKPLYKNNNKSFVPYYIAHPIIRHIVINKKN